MAAPRTANINVTIGSTEYVVSHKNFSSLSISRTAKDVCDSFELRVLDNDAYEIEAALLSGDNFIAISYIDEDMKIDKTLNGFAIKMSSSFIDNRNMLTIEGFVSTSIKDKFEKYSFPWNTVPKFDWEDVLGRASYTDYSANFEDMAYLDQMAVGFGQIWRYIMSGLSQMVSGEYMPVDDFEKIIDRIFENDWLAIDKQGNYYIQKYKNDLIETSQMDSSEMSSDEESDNIVKSNGNYCIPIKPEKLIKLVCCGGRFSDLLEEEYTDYKGTAFYDSRYTKAEWYYIKKWFKNMGKFDGLGYRNFVCDYNLDWIEQELIQTKESFFEYLYNTILPKCVQTDGKNVYSNFYLSFEGSPNNKGTVRLSRIDINKATKPLATYIYYGKFSNDGKNQGRLTSFSPKLDILTSMITQGSSSPGDEADLSKLNLVGIAGKNERYVNANKIKEEGKYKINWGIVKVTSAVSRTANKDIAISEINRLFDEAKAQPYRASATIEGFNKLAPQEYIEIVVLPKSTESSLPTQHHLSGTYFILSITDTIENGKYSSRLDLIKNVGSIGNTAVTEEVAQMAAELKYKVVTSGGAGTKF